MKAEPSRTISRKLAAILELLIANSLNVAKNAKLTS